MNGKPDLEQIIPPKNVQVFIRLPTKMIKKLDKLGEEWGMTRASFIKHIIIQYLKNEQPN